MHAYFILLNKHLLTISLLKIIISYQIYIEIKEELMIALEITKINITEKKIERDLIILKLTKNEKILFNIFQFFTLSQFFFSFLILIQVYLY